MIFEQEAPFTDFSLAVEPGLLFVSWRCTTRGPSGQAKFPRTDEGNADAAAVYESFQRLVAENLRKKASSDLITTQH